MNIFLVFAYLFFIGSITGWVIELIFRRFFSKNNPERKWINPGFCVGPYVPLYGVGLCVLFALTYIDDLLIPDTVWGFIIMIILMSIAMTIIEFIAGLLVLKVSNVMLWDYSKEWGNFKGLICPKFSLIWSLCAIAYYFLLHPKMIKGIIWLSNNLAFSFVIGFFFGVFVIDVVYSSRMLVKLRKIAVERGLIVKYESLKLDLKRYQEDAKEKASFLLPFKKLHGITDIPEKMTAKFEKKIGKLR